MNDYEPKMIKKKLKNLHLSYDASLLHFKSKKRNNLHTQPLINQIEIIVEKIQK